MNWTPEQLREYEDKRKAQSSEPKRAVRNESLAAEKREAGDTGRVHICITSRRTRLIDPDNLCGKFYLDCLRYAKLIKDDNPQEITYEMRQEKVSKGYEETIIEISTTPKQ